MGTEGTVLQSSVDHKPSKYDLNNAGLPNFLNYFPRKLTFLKSQNFKMFKQFYVVVILENKCGNCSREQSIQGRILFKEIRYTHYRFIRNACECLSNFKKKRVKIRFSSENLRNHQWKLPIVSYQPILVSFTQCLVTL